jgi:glycosyltransferase involved in cell wall biosynthesis
MKILMLNFQKKGVGTYYRSHNWAKYLCKVGHDVTIVCLSKRQSIKSKVYYEDGIRIFETPNFLDLDIISSRLSGIGNWGALDIIIRLREIMQREYDIIHAFEHHPNVSIPLYLAPKKRLPILISDWCDNYGEGGFKDCYKYRLDYFYRIIGFPLRKLAAFFEKDLRIRSQGVTVISHFLYQRAINIGIKKEKIFLIRGSVDTDKIKPYQKEMAKEKLGFNKGDKFLAFFGAHQDDLDIALEALRVVLRSEPNVYLLIIGKEDNHIRKKAAQLGIINNIIQTGWCSNQQLPWYLSMADAFLLPMKENSVNQARWPNKIGEYMAAGRPTISTRVGDVAELIEAERIGLVSEPNHKDFATKILLMLRNQELSLRMGEQARKIAEKKFALDIQGSAIESIYKTFHKK